MWSSHLAILVCAHLVACGGKLVSTEPPEPGPSELSDPSLSRPTPEPNRPTQTGRPSLPKPAEPPASPTDESTPDDKPPPPAPSPPPSDPQRPDIGATLPPTSVSCAPGQTVEMSFQIPAREMAQGAGDTDGPGYCTGFVKFEEQSFDGSYWDTTTNPWTRVYATANGRSFNPNPQTIPGHVHTSTLVHANGDRDLQYCSFWALCENGVARGVWFTW